MRPIRNVLYQAWYVLSSLRKPSCTTSSADSPIGVDIVVLDVCMQILTCESRISQKYYVLPCRILAFSKARTEQPICFNESPHPITLFFFCGRCSFSRGAAVPLPLLGRSLYMIRRAVVVSPSLAKRSAYRSLRTICW